MTAKRKKYSIYVKQVISWCLWMIDMNSTNYCNALSIQQCIATEKISPCPCSFLPWGHWMSEVTELTITNSITCTHLLELFTLIAEWLIILKEIGCLSNFYFQGTMLPPFTERDKRLQQNKTYHVLHVLKMSSLAQMIFKISVVFTCFLLVTSFNAPEWLSLYSYQNKALREEVYTWQKHYRISSSKNENCVHVYSS